MINVLLGLLIGALFMALVDYYVLGWQRDRVERYEAMTRLHTTERSLASTRRRSAVITEELKETTVKMQALRSENEIMNDNLNRLSRRLDQLDEQLETAETENDALQDTLEMLASDSQMPIPEPEPVETTTIPFDEAMLKQLQQELAEVRAKAEQASQLELENAALQEQLALADRRVQQLKAQVMNALRQVTQTQALRSQLIQAEEALSEAKAEIEALQAQLSAYESQATQPDLFRSTNISIVDEVAEVVEAEDEGETVVESETAVVSETSVESETTIESETATENETVVESETTTPSMNNGKEDDRNLEQLNGVGPTYAKRLRAAGVLTLGDLVKTPPHVVGEIVKIRDWQTAMPATWIAEAQALIDES